MDEVLGLQIWHSAVQGHESLLPGLLAKAAHGEIEYVRLMLTPLAAAVASGSVGCVQILIQAGAECRVLPGNFTLLYHAVHNNKHECINVLCDAGLDVDQFDKYGMTALMLAARDGHTESAEALLARGAQVNKKNGYGMTPLMYAAMYQRVRVIRILLDAGADYTCKTASGSSLLKMGRCYDPTDQCSAIIDEYRLTETVVRPAVVGCLAGVLPVELAELCGDYVAMTQARRAIEARRNS